MTKVSKIVVSEGHLSKIFMIRVLPGSDIIEGIEEVCHNLDIKSGAITCCIGSLQRASLLIAVPMNSKIGAGYSDPKVIKGPLELLSGQGSIGQEEEGEIFIHMHGVVSDKNGNVQGGHFIRGENPVLITCEMVLIRVEGIHMIRAYDPEVNMKVFFPKEG